MLSSGQWYKLVPKDYNENLKFRLKILKAAQKDKKIRRGLMEICKQDALFWINCFAIQINPKTREKGPFITWPYQDVAIIGGEIEIGDEVRFQHGLLACIEDQKDVRWPKSREGGASWVCLLVLVWLCLFHENIVAGAISRDEDSVDKLDDPSSLFEKIRVALKYIPDWMKGDMRKSQKKMNIVFPNGNVITGEANVGSSGVGSRFTVLLVDEFGQFDKHGEDIYNFTSDTCDCRVFVFTHKDTAGMAYQLCYDAKYARMREILTHWSQHPKKRQGLYRFNDQTNKVEILDKTFDFTSLKDFKFVEESKPLGGPCPGIRSPWYDDECIRRTERDISMNLDIDPKGSTERFFDAYRIRVLIADHATAPLWKGTLRYTREGMPTHLDRDSNGQIKMWIKPKLEGDIRSMLSRVMPTIKAGAGVDVSAGSGNSPSCLSVGNARTGEKILEYENANIYAPDFATFVCAMLRLFRDESGTHPLLVWEIQGSAAFARRMRDELFYQPYWIRREEDTVGKKLDNKGRAGWSANPAAILTLMEEYRQALYDQEVINRSETAMDETLNFIYVGSTVEYKARGKRVEDGSGAKIHHGDVVRSDALMYKMMRELGYEHPEAEQQKMDEFDPRTFDGRVRLAERKWQEEESEVWI